jgi:hypothetical protein
MAVLTPAAVASMDQLLPPLPPFTTKALVWPEAE